jgi:hypothetical protein
MPHVSCEKPLKIPVFSAIHREAACRPDRAAAQPEAVDYRIDAARGIRF